MYTDTDRDILGDQHLEGAFTKCTLKSPMQNIADLARDSAKEIGSNWKKFVEKAYEEWGSPTTMLDFAHADIKNPLRDEIHAQSLALEKLEYGTPEYTKALDKLNTLQDRMDAVPSEQIKNALRDGATDVMSRRTQYVGEAEIKMLQSGIGEKDEPFLEALSQWGHDPLERTKITGGEGTPNLQELVAKLGVDNIRSGKATTGNRTLDAYIKEEGTKAVDRLTAVTNAFEGAAKMGNLPDYAKTDSFYLPNIREAKPEKETIFEERRYRIQTEETKLKELETKANNLKTFLKENKKETATGKPLARIQNAEEKLKAFEEKIKIQAQEVEDLHNTPAEEYRSTFKPYKPFYEKKSTPGAEGHKVSFQERWNAYMHAASKSVMSPYVVKAAKVMTRKDNGFTASQLRVLDHALEMYNGKYVPSTTLDSVLDTVTNRFRNFSLTNSVGSTINNSTAVVMTVAPRYGFTNVMEAMSKVNRPGAIKDMMDALGIGGMIDTQSMILMKATGDISNLPKGTQKDLFMKSEGWMKKVASLAALSKRYGGLDKAEAEAMKILANPNVEARLEGVNKFMRTAYEAGVQTLYAQTPGDVPRLLSKKSTLSAPLRTLLVFTRQPTMEANMLWDAFQAARGATKRRMSKTEGREYMYKYFASKTMLMGRGALTFWVPTPIMQGINSHMPEVREGIETMGDVADAIAIPKMLLEKAHLDFTQTQDITWLWELPYKLWQDPKRNSAILSFGARLGDTIDKFTKGTADEKDAIRLIAGITPFITKGSIEIGGIPIGGRQMQKLTETLLALKQGKADYYGVPMEIHTPDDVVEVLSRGLLSSTPREAKITRAKSTQDPDGYRKYLVALAKTGHRDAHALHQLAEGLGVDKKKAIQSLASSVRRTTEDKAKADKVINFLKGY